MTILIDNKEFKHLLPVIALPEYFYSLDISDFGYFFEAGYILPFYIKKRVIFKFMTFTSGVLGFSESIPENIFLENLILYIKKKLDIDFITIPHTTALFNSYPQNAFTCNFGTYIIDLSLPENELFVNLHSKHRNVIKKAERDGILISNNIN